MRRISLFAMAVLFDASSAFGCPLCASDTGERVRAGIFNNEFGDTLLAMILPFLVVAAFVGLIHGGPRRAGGSPTRPPREDRPGTADGDVADRTF